MDSRELEYLKLIRKTSIDHRTYLKTRRLLHDLIYTLYILGITGRMVISTRDISRITESLYESE